jgi:hypothetical protein
VSHNYLAASWQAGNSDESLNEERFNDMWEKAIELKELTADPAVAKEAEDHLTQLIALKAQFVS